MIQRKKIQVGSIFLFVAEYYDLALVVLHQMLVQVLHLLLPETTVWAGDRLQTWTL
jgi:hypothetical protein